MGMIGVTGEFLGSTGMVRLSGEQAKAVDKRFTTENAESTEEERWAIEENVGGRIISFDAAVEMRGKEPEMERLIMLRGGVPPYFAYQGETKGLRENGLYQGETKELQEQWRVAGG
jgi:hypothetical protein